MKKTIYIIAALLLALTSCEKPLPLYDLQEDALNFTLTLDDETGLPKDKLYSFVYISDTIMTDTIWLTVNTQGFLSDQDRPFRLCQQQVDSVPNAVAGTHYTAFDSPLMQQYCVIPAGRNSVRVPVIVHRHPSLDDSDMRLNVQIQPNEHFGQGVPSLRTYPIVISNLLTQPSNWSNYYFNSYGPVKHRFMIAQTGLRWDEDFFKQILEGDYGYVKYLTMLLYQRLQAVNAERKSQGLDVLREANGKPVAFDYGGSF